MSNPIGARNLLFSILAMQKNILGTDAVIAAMKAWTTDKEKGLAQILREQKAITENQHAVLEELIDQHLARYGHDAQKSLAAVSLTGPARAEMEKIADPDVQAGLAQVSAVPILTVAPVQTPAKPTAKPPVPKKTPTKNPTPTKPSGVPTWVWLVGGMAVGVVIVVIAVTAGAVAIFLTLMPRQDEAKNEAPIAAVKPAEEMDNLNEPVREKPPIKELFNEPAIKKPVDELPIEKPVEVPPPVVATPGFVALFNGRDLAGWKQGALQPRAWRVVNGILTGLGGRLNMLYTLRDDYGDFHLRAEVRINNDGFSSLAFRYPHGPAELEKQRLGGWAVRLNGRLEDLSRTGSLLVYEKFGQRHLVAKEPLAKAGEWVTVEIIAQGNLVITKVNGQQAITYLNPKTDLMGGRIVLEANSTNRQTVVEYRKIEIKEFNVVAAPAPAAPPPAAPLQADFVPLFNGKDLTGWKQHEMFPGNWHVANGVLTGDGKSTGLLHTTRDDYQDFHLRVEGRFNVPGASSGVLCRSEGGRYGYESLFFAGKMTDGVYVRAKGPAPKIPPALLSNVKAGEWFTLEFIVQGNRLKVLANGKETADFVDEAKTFVRGHIALRQGLGATLEFRKIEIKEFNVAAAPPPLPPPAAAGGFVPLFNGKDLTGWRKHKTFAGVWQVDNGILSGSAGDRGLGRLETERIQPKNFHLRVEARINEKAQGNVAFRAPQGTLAGYESVISLLVKGNEQAGIMMAQLPGGGARTFARIGHPLFQPQPREWFTLEIIAQDQRLITKVNGVVRADIVDASLTDPGHIALTAQTLANIEFRRIEIKELNVVAAPPPPAPPLPVFAGDFVPLFNGRDLTGWKPHKTYPGAWRVEKGVLIGTAAEGTAARLHTEEPRFKDFHLRVEARASDKCLATVGFRSPDGGMRGINATANSLQFGHVRTGGLTAQVVVKNTGKGIGLLRIVEDLLPPGQWFTLDIIAEGNRLIVLVNGKKTTDTLDANYLAAGYIVLGQFGADMIEFRKIEIKELNAAAAPPPPLAQRFVPAGDFLPLFNGKDLAGWQAHLKTADNWRVEKGVLIGAGAEAGVLHTARADYKDYHLRMEARFTASADADSSSVQIRSLFGRTGYESVFADGKFTGGLYLNGKDFGKPAPAKMPANIASGDWFTLEFLARGNRLTVKVNDKETTDFVDEENHFKTGHIALRQGALTKLEFRKIEIQELQPLVVKAPPPDAPPGKGEFASLFNGKDLTGWQPHAKRPGKWRVENGILIGSAPLGGSLYSTRGDYHDFHLRAEVRINDKGFGRVFGRAAYDPTKIPFKVFGYEVLINQRPLGDKTGTLTATNSTSTIMTQAKESPAPPGEWFLLEMLAKGDHVIVKVNGNPVADFRDDKRQFARSGHIALHQDANAVIEFRKVEIDDLSAPKVIREK